MGFVGLYQTQNGTLSRSVNARDFPQTPTRVSWGESLDSLGFFFVFSFVEIRPRIDSYEGASTPRLTSSMNSPFPAQPMTPSMPIALGLLLRVASKMCFVRGSPMLGKRVGDPNLDRSEIPKTESGGI